MFVGSMRREVQAEVVLAKLQDFLFGLCLCVGWATTHTYNAPLFPLFLSIVTRYKGRVMFREGANAEMVTRYLDTVPSPHRAFPLDLLLVSIS